MITLLLVCAACSGTWAGCGGPWSDSAAEPGVAIDTAWPETDSGVTSSASSGCQPDADPAISAEELVFDPAVVVSYRAASVSADPDAWDYRGLGTETRSGSVYAPEDFWFAERFSGATHVAELDNSGEDLAVYRSEGDTLWLLGVASATPNWTALVYAPAVAIWVHPLARGDEQGAAASAVGLLEGVEYPYIDHWYGEIALSHRYVSAADAAGELVLDAGTYDALRVHVVFEGWASNGFDFEFGNVTRESWLFLSPCVGVAARITALDFAGLGL